MRAAVVVFIMFAIITMNNDASALTIIKPNEGDTYLVGQTLTIELQALPEEDIEQISILTKDFEGAVLYNPPFKYEVVINKPVKGQENIGIMALLKNGRPILLKTYIYAKLPSDLEIRDIEIEKELTVVFMTPSTNQKRKIYANGLFTDGTKHPLNTYSQTIYQSLDETIAKVDSNGAITGVYPGKTEIMVTAGNITKPAKVLVEYEIDPIKGITVVASDHSNEIKWEKSPYEGEVVSGYRIYRSKNRKGLRRIVIGNVSSGVSSFVDTQIEAGVKYYYSVEAFSQKYNTGSDMEQWISPTAVPSSSN